MFWGYIEYMLEYILMEDPCTVYSVQMYKGLYLGLPIGGPEYVEYRVGMAPVAASCVAAATLAAVECCHGRRQTCRR